MSTILDTSSFIGYIIPASQRSLWSIVFSYNSVSWLLGPDRHSDMALLPITSMNTCITAIVTEVTTNSAWSSDILVQAVVCSKNVQGFLNILICSLKNYLIIVKWKNTKKHFNKGLLNNPISFFRKNVWHNGIKSLNSNIIELKVSVYLFNYLTKHMTWNK